ncbi:MAG: response regulator [Desulfobacterales bacterium]|nr:response regulator [Desulfobacterales bacterium]
MHNILIIDDEQVVSDVLQKILLRFGYYAEIAPGGHEGIRMFDAGLFDLVITDIKMPDIDGNDVARHIRNSNRPFTPIIGISGTPWLLEDNKFDDVIPKPFSLQSLLNTVENAMYRAASSQKDSYDRTLPA